MLVNSPFIFLQNIFIHCKHSVNAVFFCIFLVVFESGFSKTGKTFGVDL